MHKKRESASTVALMEKLVKEKDLDNFIKQNEDIMCEESLSGYLKKLCAERSIIPERVILNAQLDRVYGHQIFSGTRKPSRDKVIQLAFGFGLDLLETQRLLRIAGWSGLYPKVKRDAVIIYALNKRLPVSDVQDLLYDYGLDILGDMKKE